MMHKSIQSLDQFKRFVIVKLRLRFFVEKEKNELPETFESSKKTFVLNVIFDSV